jgi:Tfp pilus assembly protein PilF
VAIALAQVLQNQPKDAVKILQELTARDRQNPDAPLYLALAALLDLDLSLAQESLQTAVQMQAQSPLIEPLQRIVQGLRSWNWVQAWQGYRSLGI